MKHLHKFILKSFLGPLFATFFISLFILLMIFLWNYIDDLAGKGLDWNIIAELILYASARLVPTALPLAFLLSSIMTFGNLGEHFELTAIKSAGVSLQRFMFPLMILTICISISAFFYSDYIIPYTNLRTRTLMFDVQNQRPELQIKEGYFYNGIEGYSIKIGKKDYNTNLLQNILIYDHKENKENTKVTLADSGYMRMTADEHNLILTLYNGYTYEELKESAPNRKTEERNYSHQRQKFEKQVVIVELTGIDFSRSNNDLFKGNFQMLNLKQLENSEDSLTNEYQEQINNFSTSLTANNYFKKELLFQNEQYQGSNSFKHSSNNPNTLLTDSLYKSQSLGDKEDIINYALTFARASQNSITSSKKQFNSKAELIRRHQIEWHRKFSLPFACLVFFLIGAPFGAIIRKGGFGTPVIISVLFFLLYYVISMMGEKFAREGIIPTYMGMWISSIILFPLGIFLTYKATNDSEILSTDAYLQFIKKFVSSFQNKLNNRFFQNS